MKPFSEMSNGEFRQAQKVAYLAMWSGQARFMLDVSGYRFEIDGEAVCKWEVYADYYHYPSELNTIVSGKHDRVRRIMKPEFDEIRCRQLELGLLQETE